MGLLCYEYTKVKFAVGVVLIILNLILCKSTFKKSIYINRTLKRKRDCPFETVSFYYFVIPTQEESESYPRYVFNALLREV